MGLSVGVAEEYVDGTQETRGEWGRRGKVVSVTVGDWPAGGQESEGERCGGRARTLGRNGSLLLVVVEDG